MYCEKSVVEFSIRLQQEVEGVGGWGLFKWVDGREETFQGQQTWKMNEIVPTQLEMWRSTTFDDIFVSKGSKIVAFIYKMILNESLFPIFFFHNQQPCRRFFFDISFHLELHFLPSIFFVWVALLKIPAMESKVSHFHSSFRKLFIILVHLLQQFITPLTSLYKHSKKRSFLLCFNNIKKKIWF